MMIEVVLRVLIKIAIPLWLFISTLTVISWAWKGNSSSRKSQGKREKIERFIFISAFFGFCWVIIEGYSSLLSFIPHFWGEVANGDIYIYRDGIAWILGVSASYLFLELIGELKLKNEGEKDPGRMLRRPAWCRKDDDKGGES